RKFLNRCANHDSDFEIIKRLDGLHISWKGARKTLTAEIAIVEGRFPKWRDVFPTGEAPTVWRGKAGALASELDPDDFIAIECQLDPTTKTVSASRPSIQLSVDVIRGNGSTRIDPDFARDYLEALPSDAIVDIQIWEPDSAIWLISQDVNRSTGALIMPLVRSR
ncbi:MAG: hypothetical protein MJA29_08925, partial [Candidatus Omnitrophica bacterium]|nr:hypothetical protein [Candidatus Omnitrophota bacterium]